MKISVHCLVVNEQNWIWYALMSVIDYVDEILVWDTGSTDKTPEIVNLINNPKIKFKECGLVDATGHSRLRQHMLAETTSDWFIILDGDEIWWEHSIRQLINTIHNNPHAAALISPFYNAVGDVFHYQNPRDINYKILDHRGGFNIRAINRKLPKLKLVNPHGKQEYQTNSIPLQNLSPDKLLYADFPYFHTTHLVRSNSHSLDKKTLKRNFKFRYDLGIRFPKHFNYPEVFYLPRPAIVPSPFSHRTPIYELIAGVFGVLRVIKKFTHPKDSEGY